jgi:hypothetical protein
LPCINVLLVYGAGKDHSIWVVLREMLMHAYAYTGHRTLYFYSGRLIYEASPRLSYLWIPQSGNSHVPDFQGSHGSPPSGMTRASCQGEHDASLFTASQCPAMQSIGCGVCDVNSNSIAIGQDVSHRTHQCGPKCSQTDRGERPAGVWGKRQRRGICLDPLTSDGGTTTQSSAL